MWAPTHSFLWVLGTRTQGLMLVLQALYLQSPLPTPALSSKESFRVIPIALVLCMPCCLWVCQKGPEEPKGARSYVQVAGV